MSDDLEHGKYQVVTFLNQIILLTIPERLEDYETYRRQFSACEAGKASVLIDHLAGTPGSARKELMCYSSVKDWGSSD